MPLFDNPAFSNQFNGGLNHPAFRDALRQLFSNPLGGNSGSMFVPQTRPPENVQGAPPNFGSPSLDEMQRQLQEREQKRREQRQLDMSFKNRRQLLRDRFKQRPPTQLRGGFSGGEQVADFNFFGRNPQLLGASQ